MRSTTLFAPSWILGMLIACSTTFANTLEDVIYKKDGSVLRGTLIEQDFANGKYKIQLSGGSVFSVDKDDIEKISKEAPLVNNGNQSGVNININNNPSINQTPQAQQVPQTPQVAQSTTPLPVTEVKNKTRGTLYIGTMSHTLKSSSIFGESESTYTGLNIAAQLNANQHMAIYTDFNIGTFSEKEETDRFGNTTTFSGDDLSDEDYTSVQIGVILSTNLYEGWQFFTGLGAFTESYSNDFDSSSASGSDIQFGLGYSWKTLQVVLRANVLNSSDYSENIDSSTTGHLQLGFNF
ncbi:hypothetical protein ACU6U9_02900 [Pseudomonas sp. HK3]|jgi:hypothetical protein